MKKMIVVFMVLCMALTAYSLRETSAEEDTGAKKLFEKKCGTCHPTDRAKSKKKSKADWEKTVMRMKNVNRAPINDEEASLIIEYLAEHYGM